MSRPTRFVVTAGVFLAAVALIARADPAVIGKQLADKMKAKMTDPAAMQRWQESQQLGQPHEFLKQAFVGKWKTTMKMWMDQSAPPMSSDGEATIEPLFGGRYVREHHTGNVMGQVFEGESTTGYDNNKKLFVSSWVDNMSTGIMTMKGSIGPDGKTVTYVGEMDEPMSGEMGKAFKLVHTIESKDAFKMEMFEILYGEPFKVMEIDYTRAE